MVSPELMKRVDKSLDLSTVQSPFEDQVLSDLVDAMTLAKRQAPSLL